MRDALMSPVDPLPEQPIWKGRSSQILNLPYFLITGLTIVISVPLLRDLAAQPAGTHWARWYPWIEMGVHGAWIFMAAFVLWQSLVLFCQGYELTSRRFFARSGVLNRHREESELFRILDLTVTKPFWLRIFGCGIVHLHTADRSQPVLHLLGIIRPEEVSDQIRNAVMLERTRLGARFAEVE